MSRWLRSIAAGVFLLVLLVGVPFALVRIAGWPLPGQVPDVGNVLTMLRQGNIPAEAVIKTIAVVVWLAWLQLAWSVLWETIVNVPRLSSGRVWRPPPLVLSPVGDGVARLFSVMLAVGVLASSTPGVASALPTPGGFDQEKEWATLEVDAVDTTHAQVEDTAQPQPQWVVSATDDLWSIAESALGDGSLVDQILELNPGVSARSLRAGTMLDLPDGARGNTGADAQHVESGGAADFDRDSQVETTAVHVESPVAAPGDALGLDVAAPQYVVQDGDGMWNVAEALLGDGSRHVEMTELALGQEVAPGVVFDADTFVIHPGWVFTLDVAVDDDPTPVRGIPRVDVGAELLEASDDSGHVTHVVVRGDTLSEIAEDHLGDENAWPEIWEQNAGEDMGGGRTFDDPNLILPGWEIDVPVEDLPTVPVHDVVDAPELNGMDDAESTPPGDATPIEQPADASPTSTSTRTPLPDDGASVPATTSPSTAGAGDLAGPTERGESAPEAPSPIRLEHAALLAAGVLTLAGVRRRRALRAALPHARVPTPAPEIAATERRLRTIDPGERAARVDIAVRAIAHRITGSGTQVGTVRIAPDGELIARLTGDARLDAPWVCDEEVGERQTWTLPASVPIEMLSDDARQSGQPCLALVTVGIDADGRDVLLDLEAAGITSIEASPHQGDAIVRAIGSGLATSLSSEVVHLFVAELGTEVLFDHPNARRIARTGDAVDAAARTVGSTLANERSAFDLRSRRTGGEMWEPAIILLAHADAASSTLAQMPAAGRGIAAVAAVDPGGFEHAESGKPASTNTPGAHVRAQADSWELAAFGESVAFTPIGLSTDDVDEIAAILHDASTPIETAPIPHVDVERSVADPLVVIPHDIVVTMMGGVTVVDRDGNEGSFQRSKTIELIAWLATHRERATRTAARTALWELDVRDATFANVVSEARRALGRLVTPPDDQEWLARTLNESLPLHERVVTDADLIRQRVDHAQVAPPAHAIEVLRPAVEMIHGLPFAGSSYLWPDADGLTSNLVLLATTASAELAAHALSVGDTDLVFWATGQGLKVLAGHEELIGLRMRAHARAGDLSGVRQEWESYERVITADSWSDGEPAPKLLDLRRQLLSPST